MRPSPHGARVLLHQREVAQFAARRPAGLFLRQVRRLDAASASSSRWNWSSSRSSASLSRRCVNQRSLRKNELIGPPDPRDSGSIPWRGRTPPTSIVRQRAVSARAASGDSTWPACPCRTAPTRPRSSLSPPAGAAPGTRTRSRPGAGLPRSAECVSRSRDRASAPASSVRRIRSIERALQQFHAGWRLWRSLCRHSTIYCVECLLAIAMRALDAFP